MVGIGYRYGICYLCIMLVGVMYYLCVVKSTNVLLLMMKDMSMGSPMQSRPSRFCEDEHDNKKLDLEIRR